MIIVKNKTFNVTSPKIKVETPVTSTRMLKDRLPRPTVVIKSGTIKSALAEFQ
jgi:hypothetical protein